MNYSIDNFVPYLVSKMKDKKPYFLARIGGSDFEIMTEYIHMKEDKKTNILETEKFDKFVKVVSNYNGYFNRKPHPERSKKIFEQYLNIMADSFKNCSDFTYGGFRAIERMEGRHVKKYKHFDYYVNKYLKAGPTKNYVTYTFLESVYPFLNAFKQFAEKKKILVVSPFSPAIQQQFLKKDKIINNYQYPDFKLVTYTTPITYNNDKDEMPFIKTKNWVEQTELMCEEITKLDFDIALLSCGSYAMPLGDHIFRKMGKKAIYVGGILNVLFNIYGGRYNTTFFNSIMNLEHQIKFEPEIYKDIKGGRIEKTEAFNAYF